MKVLFVAPRFHTNQLPLVRTLKRHGHQVAFHVRRVGKSEDHTDVKPQVVRRGWLSHCLERMLAWNSPASRHHFFPSLPAYLRLLRETAPDIVVIKNPTHPFALLASVAARVQGRRILFYTQGPVHAPPSKLRDIGRAGLLSVFGASGFSPVEGDSETYRRSHHLFHYLPFIADGEAEPKQNWFDGGRINILSVGKFVPRKNHLLLLEAVSRLREKFSLRLTVVGECVTTEHREQYRLVENAIARLGLGGTVHLRTNVPFRFMDSLYRSHDLFVLPSRKEPAGVSHLEAMARGLPVICSTTNGTRCYVREGVNGRVFQSDSVDELTRALEDVMRDRRRLMEMGRASLELARTVHDGERIYRRFMELASERPRAQQPPTTERKLGGI